MLFTLAEDDVFKLIPPNIKRPSEIAADPIKFARSGVDINTFNRYAEQYEAYILSEIYKAGLPTPTLPIHVLLNAAQSYMVAGAILRMFDNVQNPYKDMYATGNIMLRAYIDQELLLNKTSINNAPEFYSDTDQKSQLFSFLD